MDATRPNLLTAREISAAFSDPFWAEKFPPILSVEQAASLLQVPKGTIYDWSSRGLLAGCAFRVGKHLRVWRDRLILLFTNQGIHI